MVQHRLKTHYGVQPKRRRPQNKIVATLAPTTTTTTTYHIKDGEMIDEQVRFYVIPLAEVAETHVFMDMATM